MENGKKEFRYSDRARSFDESLEEELSSFKSNPEPTNDTQSSAGAPMGAPAEKTALDRMARTAGDEVSEITRAPVDSTKVASELLEYEIGGKIRKMAAARPEFIDRFLKESAQPSETEH